MIYCRAHDATMEADYYAAMSRVEQRLELVGEQEKAVAPVSENKRGRLLSLADRLVELELSFELRLEIAFQIRGLLNGPEIIQVEM